MADRKYSIGRPSQEVRLKNWDAGRVAQFKKAIEILETELNTSIAAQTDQGAKRVVSNRIPKVTGLAVASGFKSFSISFAPAKGIPDLLFYEIQKANTANFASPTTFTSPQTTLTIPTSTEKEQIYVRVRVMDSKFKVGPWSATVAAIGSSNFRINTTRGERTTLEIAIADFDTWVDVQTISIPISVSAISVSVQPGLNARMSKDVAPYPSVAREGYTSSYKAYFRLLKNGVEVTDAGTIVIAAVSTYANDFGEGEASERKVEKAFFGVLVSPLESFATSQTVEYTIQVKVDSGETHSIDRLSASVPLIDLPLIIIDNFDALEIIQIA